MALTSMKKVISGMKMSGTKKGSGKTMKKSKKIVSSTVATGKKAKAAVWKGHKLRTKKGMRKDNLRKSTSSGKIVSKRVSENSKQQYLANGLDKFNRATMAARTLMNIQGFCPVGGKTERGQALLKKAREIFREY